MQFNIIEWYPAHSFMWVNVKMLPAFRDFVLNLSSLFYLHYYFSFMADREIHSESVIAHYAKFIINIKFLMLLWKYMLDIYFLVGKSFLKDYFVFSYFCSG